MREEISAALQVGMKERGIDALMVLSPENFAYISGFVVPSQSLLRWRHAVYILTSDGRKAILCVDMEESTVRKKSGDVEVRAWGEFTDDPMHKLAELLSEMGLGSARIGTEFDFIPAGDHARLTAAVPSAEFVPAERFLARQRQIKTPQELQLMTQLSRIADQSIHDAFQAVSAGSSEMDIAGALTQTVYRLGADGFKLMIVATGERSVFPNVGPSERILKSGDICRVEIFAMKDGYHAGVCRTAFVDQPPEHAEKIWKNLDECKQIVLDMVKPGVSSHQVYEAFTAHLGKLDLPPIDFIGHGIGLHLHEEPYLGRYSDVPLEEGMVLGVEPLVYNTGYGFGMQNKDIVAVVDGGCRLLSDYTDTKYLIEVN